MKTLVDVDKLVFEPPKLGCTLYLPGLPGGNSRIYDRSPYGNYGTITGATWKRLPSGLWFLSFDGTDDYVGCGSNASLKALPISVELWFRRLGAGSSGTDSLISPNLYAGDKGWSIEIIEATPAIQVHGRGGTSTLTLGPSTIVDDTWYYVAFAAAANEQRFYLNGTEEDSNTLAVPFAYNSFNLTIGAHPLSPAYRFVNCDIALPRIYNYALSALEIQNHFNQEKHLFGVW